MSHPDPIHQLEQTLADAARDLPADAFRRFMEDVGHLANYAKAGRDLVEAQTALEREGPDAARTLAAARTA